MRPRVAPRAARAATSRRRLELSTSDNLPMLAQTMSSVARAAAASINRRGRDALTRPSSSPTICQRIGRAATPQHSSGVCRTFRGQQSPRAGLEGDDAVRNLHTYFGQAATPRSVRNLSTHFGHSPSLEARQPSEIQGIRVMNRHRLTPRSATSCGNRP